MRYHLKAVKMAIIKMSTKNTRWRGCGEKGGLLHCWWECKLIQPLWKTVWIFFKNVGIKPLYDPAIPLLGIYPAAAAKSLQSCPTLCDPIDGSPLGSTIPGILQARTLEWFAISFSNAWKWKWSRSLVSDSWRPHGLQPTRLLRPWDPPGKNTSVGCHVLLQGIFLTQELNLCFLCLQHGRQICYTESHAST